MDEEQRFIASLPTELARSIYRSRSSVIAEVKRRAELVSVVNQLLAIELCPYSPGQIVGKYTKSAKKFSHVMIFSVPFRRNQPFYSLIIRDYNPDTKTFITPPYPGRGDMLIASVKFAPTEEFCERGRELYIAGEIGQIPMTPSQVKQAHLLITHLLDYVSFKKLPPEHTQLAGQLGERLSFLGRSALSKFDLGGTFIP